MGAEEVGVGGEEGIGGRGLDLRVREREISHCDKRGDGSIVEAKERDEEVLRYLTTLRSTRTQDAQS